MSDTKDIVVAIYRVGATFTFCVAFGFAIVAREINEGAYLFMVIALIYAFILSILADIKNNE